jgi:hypothetical protein
MESATVIKGKKGMRRMETGVRRRSRWRRRRRRRREREREGWRDRGWQKQRQAPGSKGGFRVYRARVGSFSSRLFIRHTVF